MADTTSAGEFQSILGRVLRAFPGPGLETKLEENLMYADEAIDVCRQEFGYLQAGVELRKDAVEVLNEAVPHLQRFEHSSELKEFYVAARGLTSQWLHYPGGKTLLVHSVALHIAETVLRYPEVSITAAADWNIAVLKDPEWLRKELVEEYRAALNSLETGQPSKIPQRIRGGTHIWRFGVDEATDDFSGFHRRGLWWPQFLQGNSWIKERLDEWLEKGYMKVDPKAPKKGEVAFLKSFLRSNNVQEP